MKAEAGVRAGSGTVCRNIYRSSQRNNGGTNYWKLAFCREPKLMTRAHGTRDAPLAAYCSMRPVRQSLDCDMLVIHCSAEYWRDINLAMSDIKGSRLAISAIDRGAEGLGQNSTGDRMGRRDRVGVGRNDVLMVWDEPRSA